MKLVFLEVCEGYDGEGGQQGGYGINSSVAYGIPDLRTSVNDIHYVMSNAHTCLAAEWRIAVLFAFLKSCRVL